MPKNASPIFLMQCEKVRAEGLELYKLESRNGRRELTVSPKKPGRAIRITVTRLTTDGLNKIEVDESPGTSRVYGRSFDGGRGDDRGIRKVSSCLPPGSTRVVQVTGFSITVWPLTWLVTWPR